MIEQHWTAVSDGNYPGTTSHVECSRCGYQPRFALDASSRCPRCTPVYEALEALQRDIAEIRERLK